MALPQKINNLPAWSLSKINRWADYIELCCINNADHIFSIDDLVDHYLEENGEHIERGENEHSEKYDALINDFVLSCVKFLLNLQLCIYLEHQGTMMTKQNIRGTYVRV